MKCVEWRNWKAQVLEWEGGNYDQERIERMKLGRKLEGSSEMEIWRFEYVEPCRD